MARFGSQTLCSVALGMMMLPASAMAGLIIEASDITDNQYIYEMNASDMIAHVAGNIDLFSDMESHTSNLAILNDNGVYLVRPRSVDTADRSASLVYKFDFTALGLAVEGGSWRDKLDLFGGNQGAEDTLATTAYSTDGVTWTTISQADTTDTTSSDFASTGLQGQDFTLGTPSSIIYYRVEFESALTDTDGFTGNTNQWNRTGNNAPTFRATFNLIPEPGSFGLLSIGLCLLLRRQRD